MTNGQNDLGRACMNERMVFITTETIITTENILTTNPPLSPSNPQNIQEILSYRSVSHQFQHLTFASALASRLEPRLQLYFVLLALAHWLLSGAGSEVFSNIFGGVNR
jgi:hypothetical protein